MSTREEEMDAIRICAVCGRVLTRVRTDGVWNHTHGLQDQPEDHPAVPVERGETAGIDRCDFCSADHPTWLLPVATFEVQSGVNSVGDWSACEVCVALIQANQWGRLTERGLSTYTARHGEPVPGTRAELLRVHRAVRKNTIGAPRLIAGPPSP